MFSDVPPDFQVFVHRAVPMTAQPFVTVQKRGMLSLNNPAYRLLGSPAAVELLYDHSRAIVGLRAVESTADHAYPLRATSRREDTSYVVSATAFLRHFGIGHAVSRRWAVTLRHGALLLDLATIGTPVSSNRTGTRRSPRGRDEVQ